jgi:NuA3 HAT complex component NTO1
MQYIGKVSVRKKRDFVLSVCKYWSLKREARRGAPLLKRLHLEVSIRWFTSPKRIANASSQPWTASSASRQQTDEEKARRLVVCLSVPVRSSIFDFTYALLQHLERLRKDLEKVRMLAELARKREKEKYKQAQLLDTTLTTFLFPHEPMLRLAYEQIRT